jgi:hypothetical protein
MYIAPTAAVRIVPVSGPAERPQRTFGDLPETRTSRMTVQGGSRSRKTVRYRAPQAYCFALTGASLSVDQLQPSISHRCE